MVCEILEDLVKRRSESLNEPVRRVLSDYAKMLRRHYVSDRELEELCQQIYSRHKEALDLIFEHRPDRQQRIAEALETLIKASDSMILDQCDKSHIRFLPEALDSPGLKRAVGWTKTNRILLFELHNESNSLKLKLMLGPGDLETRQKLFDLAKENEPPFGVVSKSLNAKWTALFSRTFLSPPSYDGTDEQIEAEVEQQWSLFVKDELPGLLKPLATEGWTRKAQS